MNKYCIVLVLNLQSSLKYKMNKNECHPSLIIFMNFLILSKVLLSLGKESERESLSLVLCK